MPVIQALSTTPANRDVRVHDYDCRGDAVASVSGVSKVDGTIGVRLRSDAAIFDTFNNALANKIWCENV
jgi:hypothetical protein